MRQKKHNNIRGIKLKTEQHFKNISRKIAEIYLRILKTANIMKESPIKNSSRREKCSSYCHLQCHNNFSLENMKKKDIGQHDFLQLTVRHNKSNQYSKYYTQGKQCNIH